MTVSLKSNFFQNSRGFTFEDANGVSWSFNSNTNQLTASVSGAAGGTVTSVGLSDGSTTPIYAISDSPVATSGNLTFTFKTQSANTVLAGPATGSAAQPTFRALVNADLPTSGASAGSYTYASITVNAQGVITAAASGTTPPASSSGTFTGTLTGVTSSTVTCTCAYTKIGNIVSLTINASNATVTGTSNATTMTLTGLPAALQPATYDAVVSTNGLVDNTADTSGQMQISPASGTIQFSKTTSASFSSWTSSGTKGINWPITITYPLN